MKTRITFIACLALAISFSLQAQKTVVLSIDHLLEGEKLEFNDAQSSSVADNYEVTRLEYYLSEFKITHDGGQLIQLPDTWLLVNGGDRMEVVLGDFAITELEELEFKNGVGTDYNHLDPTLYPSGHPLSIGVPSMHWGWTSGYRFLAIEGNAGSSLGFRYEVHALGDQNLKTVNIPTIGQESNDTIYIELEAFCEAIFQGIDISSGVISHGETGDAEQALINLQRNVFSAKNRPSSTTEVSYDKDIRVVYDQHKIELNRLNAETDVEYRLHNLLGQELATGSFLNKASFKVEKNGIYLLSFSKNGNTFSTKKVLVY